MLVLRHTDLYSGYKYACTLALFVKPKLWQELQQNPTIKSRISRHQEGEDLICSATFNKN